MNYIAVLEQIKKGQVSSCYLIYGEEIFLARQVEKTIVDAILLPDERDMNLIVFSTDPQPQELINFIETVPFMGGKNVITIRGTNMFRSRKEAADDGTVDTVDERLLAILSDMPEYSHVIFMTTEKIDKRRKIYKTVEKYGTVVEVAPLKAKDVRLWLNSKLSELNKRMTADAMEHFLAVISVMSQVSLGFLDNELEKIALYTDGTVISKEHLLEVLSAIPEVSVFAMIEAVSQKQTQKALHLFEEQLAAGEHPLKLLALLARQVRLLWQARDMMKNGRSSKEIAEELGVMPFIGEKLVRQSRGFTDNILKEAVIALAQADHDLKFGRAGNVALEKIIIDMCR